METIQDVLGEDPPVLVHPQVKEGHAAELLIGLSEDADLLVVGSRGFGGFAGMLLGSVSQHVAAYAKCTVVVVRSSEVPLPLEDHGEEGGPRACLSEGLGAARSGESCARRFAGHEQKGFACRVIEKPGCRRR